LSGPLTSRTSAPISHSFGRHGALALLRRALKEPGNVLQVLRARYELRDCTSVPMSVRVRGRVFVQNQGQMAIGQRVRIDGRMNPVEIVAWRGSRLTIGDGTFLNYGVSLSTHQELTIGRDCLIGNYVTIIDNDYHDLNDRSRLGPSSPIVIGDRVWIGIRSVVLRGVKIGDGSVVGAGSVVTSDIPPNSLAVGVPAKVIRSLS
jgi:acetyltransferase-like isoleucine patch superfamily enzyme